MSPLPAVPPPPDNLDNVDNLDDLLGAWARSRRLPEAEAEAVLRAIVRQPRAVSQPSVARRPTPAEQPPALPATWWCDFNAWISAAVVRATSTPAPALAALQHTDALLAATT